MSQRPHLHAPRNVTVCLHGGNERNIATFMTLLIIDFIFGVFVC